MNKIVSFEERAEALRLKKAMQEQEIEDLDPAPGQNRERDLRVIFKIIKRFSAFELRELIKVLAATLRDMEDDPETTTSSEGS